MSSAAPSSSSSTAPALTFTGWRAKGAAPLARLAAAFPGRPLPSSSIPSDASFKDYHASMAKVVQEKLRREPGPVSTVGPADTTFPEWHESTSQRVLARLSAFPSSGPVSSEERAVRKALKKALDGYDIPQGFADAGRTALLPIELPLQALEKAVDEGTYATVWPDLLREYVPGMPMASLGPTTPAKEYYLRILRALRSVAPCVSNVRRFDVEGAPTENVSSNQAAMPAFLRYRLGRYFLTVCWILSGIQLHRLGLNGHIEALTELLDGADSLTSQYGRQENVLPLSASNVRLDVELRSLFAPERPEGGIKLDTLLYLVQESKSIGRNPAAGCATAATNYVRDISYAYLEALGKKGEGKQLAANIRQAIVDLRDSSTYGYWRDRMVRITNLVVEVFGEKLLHINREGVCTLAYKGAATIDVRRFVLGAWARNQTKCDIGAKERHGVHVWGKDDYWLAYAMMVAYCAQHGARDSTCHFPFDDSGEKHRSLGFTAIARKDHSRRSFEELKDLAFEGLNRAGIERIVASNATMQLSVINDILCDDDFSSFAAGVQQTRPGCTEVLVRTAEGGVPELALTEAQRQSSATEGGPFPQETFERLRDNAGGNGGGSGSGAGDGGGGNAVG